MMNEQNTTSLPASADNPLTLPAEQPEWKGMTIDELRLRRAVALVRKEMGKERMAVTVEGLKGRVADNGVRGLLFNDKTITGLKTADYVLLGWKLARSLLKLWARRK